MSAGEPAPAADRGPRIESTALFGDPDGVAPAGWYPDPRDAGRERWWTGSAWSEHTHRPAVKGWLGVDHARTFWAGANRAARVARGLSVGSLLLWFGVVVASLAFGSAGRSPGVDVAIILLGLLVVSLLMAVAAVIVGVVGRRRASRLGGGGAAGRAIVIAVSSIVVGCWLLGISFLALFPAEVASLFPSD